MKTAIRIGIPIRPQRPLPGAGLLEQGVRRPGSACSTPRPRPWLPRARFEALFPMLEMRKQGGGFQPLLGGFFRHRAAINRPV